jgi:nicotinic acetylcholine receptor
LIFNSIEVYGHAEAKRLLYELMKDYNKHVLPVPSINQTVNVTLGLKLSQLSDIDERNQIMTTNVWLQHVKFYLKIVI